MDDDSECDWSPPSEVQLVESQVFQIPSGLPSLDDFIRTELEREAAAAAAELEKEIVEVEEEVHADEGEATTTILGDEVSLAEHPIDEVEVDAAVTQEIQSDEDEVELAPVEVKKSKKPVKKVTDEWYEVDTMKIGLGEQKLTASKQAKEELRLRLISSTQNFLGDVIDKVVEICEYEDPDEILRTRLNKDMLLKELDEAMMQLDLEQRIMVFLNRKTAEYFRRKKTLRPLTDDHPDVIGIELRKYREALRMVNNFKGREEASQKVLEAKINDLREQVKCLESKCNQASADFVSLVKAVFAVDGSEKMNTLIDYLIHKVENIRKEIAKVRFVLIQRQHTMATLQDRARKLEDLGNGLRMIDFEHLQTETQALGKKIEERHNELNRLQNRCNADIHTFAHIREKKHMIRNTIAAQQETYDELIIEKQDCREYVNRLKIERGSIRREIQKISYQGGLLDKPELLLDYDVTVNKTNVLQAKVSQMKADQLIVDNKLKHLMRLLQ